VTWWQVAGTRGIVAGRGPTQGGSSRTAPVAVHRAAFFCQPCAEAM